MKKDLLNNSNYEIRIKCYCQNSDHDSKALIKCNSCNKFQHKECIKLNIYFTYYECAWCQNEKNNLYIINKKELAEPIFINYINNFNNINNTEVINYKREFKLSYKLFKKSIKNLGIIVRSIRLDEKGYIHNWPYNCNIEIVSNVCSYEDKISYSEKTSLCKERPDFPVILVREEPLISNYSKLCFTLMTENKIMTETKLRNKDKISFSLNFNNYYSRNRKDIYSYVIFINYCEFVNVNNIINSTLIASTKMNYNYIKEKLNDGIMEFTIVNLNNIYTSKSIKYPGRSYNCNHMDVFDIESFISLQRNIKGNDSKSNITNSSRSLWKCPICKKQANNFYIDNIILKFMEENPTINTIRIDKNMNITKYCYNDDKKVKENKGKSNEKHKPVKEVEIIRLDDD